MAASVRDWPRSKRRELLKGPEATVELDNGEERSRTVISVPRAAFKVFSTVANDLLQDDAYANVFLPQGSAAPAALRYVVEWIPRACDSCDFMPIKKKEDFKQNIRIYHAALSLGVTEALTTIGGWLNIRISTIEKDPLGWDETKDMLTTLPKTCSLVLRLIEKTALARRRQILDERFLKQLSEFLQQCPELAQHFYNEDNPPKRNNRAAQIGCVSPSASQSDRSTLASSRSNSTNTLPNGSRRSSHRGGHGRNRSSQTNGAKAPDNDYALSEAEVDFLMCRIR